MVILGVLSVPLITLLSDQLFVYLQSVQAYVSPPIAAVFIFGLFWSRANAKGSIYALIFGAILGAARFISEILVKNSNLDLGFFNWFASMNFLHFAVFLFVVSAVILIGVSLLNDPPVRSRIAGLTYSTANELQSEFVEKMNAINPRWTTINIIASVVLALTVFVIWGIFS